MSPGKYFRDYVTKLNRKSRYLLTTPIRQFYGREIRGLQKINIWFGDQKLGKMKIKEAVTELVIPLGLPQYTKRDVPRIIVELEDPLDPLADPPSKKFKMEVDSDDE